MASDISPQESVSPKIMFCLKGDEKTQQRWRNDERKAVPLNCFRVVVGFSRAAPLLLITSHGDGVGRRCI